MEEVEIELFDSNWSATAIIVVEKLSENKFKMTDNNILNFQLTKGTEFETIINKEGKHEVTKIIKNSNFITKRFLLPPEYKVSDYQMLGEELVKFGGFWQVDFCGIVTVNIPADFKYDIEIVMKDLEINLIEITDDEK
jgi:hypothetical protein